MAKSDVGTITVYLEARSQAFDAGIKKATSSIGKLEGRLKQTGMAFTEFQSKIGVTVAAVEVLAKASDAAARAMKGDFDGVVETMRQLPMGLGTAFGAMYDLSTRHIWGHADEIAASKEQIKRLEEKQAQLTKLTAADEARRLQISQARVLLSTKSADLLTHEVMRNEAIADIERQRVRDTETITRLNSLTGGLSDQAARRHIDRINSGANELKDIHQEIFEIEQQRLALDFNAERIQNIEQAAQAEESRLREAAAHWASYYSQIGAGDETRLKLATNLNQKLLDLYDKQLAVLSAQKAEQVDLDAVQQKIDAQRLSHMRFLHLEEARMRAKLSDSERPSAVSMSFGTPVGSITLPDRANTAALMREHISEQRRTTEEVKALQRELNQWSIQP